MDAELLSRFQFAFTIAFHIVFPSLTIGLASYLAVLEGIWLMSGRDVYLAVYRYWLKIFALCFSMGVVSGIVMSYQFGTNWGPFADKTGPVLGPLLGYEVLTAFFLEAGFLGVMLFGMQRVGKRLHFLATLLVAVGTLISTFWILSANSWMQTPAGFIIENGQFVPSDWWAVIFNPSFPYRLVHMVLAAYLTTAFVVGAAGAYHLLRDRAIAPAAVMFSMAMWMATIVAPLQLVVGDFHGLNTLEHQPAKIAALEGHWETQRGAPLILFGIPNQEEEKTEYEIAIPKLGSLILTHEFDGEIRGLKSWPKDERPPAAIVFWSFRVMVGIGFAMAFTGLLSVYFRLRGRLATPWFLRLAILMGPTGFIAVIAGWITTEVGRQPFLVYGLMRVAEGRSHVDAPAVAGSLLSFIVVYFVVFGAGIYYMFRVMAQTPGSGEPAIDSNQLYRASYPLSATRITGAR
jgi:cytochrome bd ubiquinol oxidase subunit I